MKYIVIVAILFFGVIFAMEEEDFLDYSVKEKDFLDYSSQNKPNTQIVSMDKNNRGVNKKEALNRSCIKRGTIENKMPTTGLNVDPNQELMKALAYPNIVVHEVKCILDTNADVNYKKMGKKGKLINTPLSQAIVHNAKIDVIKLLLNRKADTNCIIQRSEFGSTPLMQLYYRALKDSPINTQRFGDIFKLLVNNKANINYRDGSDTVLHRMVQNPAFNDLLATNLLTDSKIVSKIDWSVQDAWGNLVLDSLHYTFDGAILTINKDVTINFSQKKCKRRLPTIFLHRKFFCKKGGFEKLFALDRKVDWKIPSEFDYKNALDSTVIDISFPDYRGDTLLHHCMRSIPCSELSFNPKGNTQQLQSILGASFWNSDYVDFIRAIITNSSDLSVQNSYKYTPLRVALVQKNIFGVLFLIYHGAQYTNDADSISAIFNEYANRFGLEYAFLKKINTAEITHENFKKELENNFPQYFMSDNTSKRNPDSWWSKVKQYFTKPVPASPLNQQTILTPQALLDPIDCQGNAETSCVKDDENLVVIEKTGKLGTDNLKLNSNEEDNHNKFEDLSDLPKPQGNVFLRFFRHVRNIPSYTIRAFFPAKKEKFQECRTLKGFL